MLVAFFGDTHGNLNAMYDYARAWEKRTGLELRLIVQVGDFGFWINEGTVDKMTKKHAEQAGRPAVGDYPQYILGERQAPTPTLVIRGNHEDQPYLRAHEKQLENTYPEDYLTRSIELVPNIHYLPDGHIVEVEGVRFGGLGGNFSIKSWERWNYWDLPEGRRQNHFTRDRWNKLAFQKFDVLLCHDAPNGIGLQGSPGLKLPEDESTHSLYGYYGCPFLRELVEVTQPRYAFFGHWHHYIRTRIGETQCYVLDKTTLTPEPSCMEVIEL